MVRPRKKKREVKILDHFFSPIHPTPLSRKARGEPEGERKRKVKKGYGTINPFISQFPLPVEVAVGGPIGGEGRKRNRCGPKALFLPLFSFRLSGRKEGWGVLWHWTSREEGKKEAKKRGRLEFLEVLSEGHPG